MMHNWEFNHLGMMVTDRDEILSYYQPIGLGVSVGPQPLLPYIEGEGEMRLSAHFFAISRCGLLPGSPFACLVLRP